jgi:hypothetical protein
MKNAVVNYFYRPLDAARVLHQEFPEILFRFCSSEEELARFKEYRSESPTTWEFAAMAVGEHRDGVKESPQVSFTPSRCFMKTAFQPGFTQKSKLKLIRFSLSYMSWDCNTPQGQ